MFFPSLDHDGMRFRHMFAFHVGAPPLFGIMFGDPFPRDEVVDHVVSLPGVMHHANLFSYVLVGNGQTLVVEADLVVIPYAQHFRVRRGFELDLRQRLQKRAFLFEGLSSGELTPFDKGSVVQVLQVHGHISFDGVKTHVLRLHHLAEDALLNEMHGTFNGSLVTRGPRARRQRRRAVVLATPQEELLEDGGDGMDGSHQGLRIVDDDRVSTTPEELVHRNDCIHPIIRSLTSRSRAEDVHGVR